MPDLVDRLPSDFVRHNLGPMLSSKDLARLCASSEKLQWRGATHHADGPLNESELAVLAAATGVEVRQFTGTFTETVSGEELRLICEDANKQLKDRWMLEGALYRPLLLGRKGQYATTVATCNMVNGKLHGRLPSDPRPRRRVPVVFARTLDIGRHVNAGVTTVHILILRRNEFWHNGRFFGAHYVWIRN